MLKGHRSRAERHPQWPNKEYVSNKIMIALDSKPKEQNKYLQFDTNFSVKD